ncbi:hypothetical protein R70723_19935 [Paenibacillus sp. FSL R7-0273]|uniref:hypothetical protein n=1 Tax=Paenibacillus sp. FSL R7-0273 TaxID=1536772 RepID=UPI0004F7F899|nr:hypothetical protein [Paenibacillus sp. FSL R7-0273]AIQ47921.1 hypothetical protein R70723_19935 [Paenibacillus sp. FSL R7-0273]OMF94530.1 hypothetical protein BK144_08360 [Paenibacillus sp. FSL R7-0273]
MFFILILIVVAFSVLFIFKDAREEYLKNFSLLGITLPIILAVLLLSSAAFDFGFDSFSYLGVFELEVTSASALLKTFAGVSLVSLLLYFYSLTKR